MSLAVFYKKVFFEIALKKMKFSKNAILTVTLKNANF